VVDVSNSPKLIEVSSKQQPEPKEKEEPELNDKMMDFAGQLE